MATQTSEEKQHCIDYLQSVPIKSLIPTDRTLVEVRSDTPISECLALLNGKKILSVPVYELQNRADGATEKNYIGIANLFELFVPLAFKPYFESSLSDTEYFSPEKFDTHRLTSPVSEWIGTSPEGEVLWAAQSHESVYNLIEKMAKGVHRYLIEDRVDGKPVHQIITQSDLIRFISIHRKQLGGVLSMKLSDISLPKTSALKTLASDLRVVEGLREMYRENLPSLGVVDRDTGVLIGNFSLSDLRGLEPTNLKPLLASIHDFLLEVRKGSGRKSVITCTREHTVEQAIDIMLTERVHRLWIVDAEGKPVTVCTMSNLNYLFF